MRTINTKLNSIVPKSIPTEEQTIGMKPKGLWYGFDDSWIDWVKNEVPEWLGDNNFELIVSTNRILSIDSDKELIEFTEKYADKNSNIGSFINNSMIDWKKVSKDYAGIEIPIYLHNMRLSVFWYYGWDCASGCIWDTSIIKKINKL